MIVCHAVFPLFAPWEKHQKPHSLFFCGGFSSTASNMSIKRAVVQFIMIHMESRISLWSFTMPNSRADKLIERAISDGSAEPAQGIVGQGSTCHRHRLCISPTICICS